MLDKITDIKNKFEAMPWQKQLGYGVLTVGTTLTAAYFASKGVMLLYKKLFKKPDTEAQIKDAIDHVKEIIKNNPDLLKKDSEPELIPVEEAKVIELKQSAA